MAAHRTWQDVATGDFVSIRLDAETTASELAATGVAAPETVGAGLAAPDSALQETTPAENAAAASTDETAGTELTASWTRIGIVVRPEDLGLSHLESLVVVLGDGSVGDLLPTIRSRTGADLAITAGPEAGREAVIAALHQAMAAAGIHPVDKAGEALLDHLGIEPGVDAPAADSGAAGSDAAGPGAHVRTLLGRIGDPSGEGHRLEIFARRCPLDGNKLPCSTHSYDVY